MFFHSILLVVVLHGVYSYYFYNPYTHHVLTLASLANVPRGYKLIPPPFQRRSIWQDGDNHVGQCLDPGFICTRPYDISATYQFRCSKDAQCPKFHKCCHHKCFVHNICMKSTMQPRHRPKTTLKLKSQRAGTCEKWLYNCHIPYHNSLTSLFKCDHDRQCPKSFKCCEQNCFEHKICSRAIIHNDGYVEELRKKETKTIVKPAQIETSNEESTENIENQTNDTATDENNEEYDNDSTVKSYEETTENVVDSITETTKTKNVFSESATTSEFSTEETTNENAETTTETQTEETTNEDAETTTESLTEETTNENADTTTVLTEETTNEDAETTTESSTEENVSTTDESEYSSVFTTEEENSSESTTELSTEENISSTNELEYSSDIITETKDMSDNTTIENKDKFTMSKLVMKWSTPDPNAINPEYDNYDNYYYDKNDTAYDSDSYN